MSTDRLNPRLRVDLMMHGFQAHLGRYLLEDPRTGRAFTFRQKEYAIIERCSGALSVGDIGEVIFQTLGARIPTDIIERFIQRLDELGLLERPNDGYLQIPTATIRPDGVDRSHAPWLVHCLKVAAGVFLGKNTGRAVFYMAFESFVFSIRQRDAYSRDARIFLSPSRAGATVSLIYLSLPLIALVHELGHILAAFRFTGKIFRIHVQLRRLKITVNIPSAEIWRLGRQQRTYIALAGIYLQIVLLSAILTIWPSVFATEKWALRQPW